MARHDDILKEARKRYEAAREAWAPIYERMREDLRFSDPTGPQQWPEAVKRERQNAEGGPRPCLTFDQTGQYVRQVVNQARRNKPAMKFLPVDDRSDVKLAGVLQGLARQTEHESRADVAYITALDHAVRGGIGFFRLVTEVEDEATNTQCAKIVRVVDPETVLIDPDFLMPDGSDAMFGFVEEAVPRERFERLYPKAKMIDFDSKGWFGDKHVRVCEYLRVVETTTNVIVAGGRKYSEQEYWDARMADPMIPAGEPKPEKSRKVEWFKLTGEEVLEESEFPAEFIGIFPVLGNESWEDGKRHLGGAVRLARDPQIAFNFERNAEIETAALAPKAPYVGPAEAIEGHESKWERANHGNITYLPYNSVGENGEPIQAPIRVAPPQIATGWAALSERSRQDVQSALGMFNATVGDNPNSQSGRAVMALQDQAQIGSFHYIDNLALSISHLGRVLTQVWPRIYDTERVVRVLGEDDESKFVRVVPDLPRGYYEDGDQILVNPSVGRYDVRVSVGPSYTTRQVEAAAEIGEIVNGNPQLMSMLGDVWVKMRNFPEAEKIAKRFKAMLPPQVVQAEEEEGQPQIPPEVVAAVQQMQAQMQQMQAALQEAQSGIEAERIKAATSIEVARINADAKTDVEELKGMLQLILQHMQPPPQLLAAVNQDLN